MVPEFDRLICNFYRKIAVARLASTSTFTYCILQCLYLKYKQIGNGKAKSLSTGNNHNHRMECMCNQPDNHSLHRGSCKPCPAHRHLGHIYYFDTCYCSNPYFECTAHSTGSNCRTNCSNHQECPSHMYVIHCCNRCSTCRDISSDSDLAKYNLI